MHADLGGKNDMCPRLKIVTWKRSAWLNVYKQVHEDRELYLRRKATRIRASVQNQKSVFICPPDQNSQGIYFFFCL